MIPQPYSTFVAHARPATVHNISCLLLAFFTRGFIHISVRLHISTPKVRAYSGFVACIFDDCILRLRKIDHVLFDCLVSTLATRFSGSPSGPKASKKGAHFTSATWTLWSTGRMWHIDKRRGANPATRSPRPGINRLNLQGRVSLLF